MQKLDGNFGSPQLYVVCGNTQCFKKREKECVVCAKAKWYTECDICKGNTWLDSPYDIVLYSFCKHCGVAFEQRVPPWGHKSIEQLKEEGIEYGEENSKEEEEEPPYPEGYIFDGTEYY